MNGTTLISSQAPAILSVGTRLDGDFSGPIFAGNGTWLSVQPDDGGIPATVNLDIGNTSNLAVRSASEWLMTGAGMLTLTGDSVGYTGAATIAAGALRVDGTVGNALSTFDVAVGAALGGGGGEVVTVSKTRASESVLRFTDEHST